MTRKGYFIVLEGIDGVGKTTLCKSVKEYLSEYEIIFCSRKEILNCNDFIQNEMLKVANLMWKDDMGKNDHLLPTNYYIHLQAIWYTLLETYIIRPKLNENKIVITDGWFYKFFSKLMIKKLEFDKLSSIFENILIPDHVILLEMDVSQIWNRRNNFKPYELGSHQGYEKLGKDSYIDFQSQVSSNLQVLAENNKWSIMRMDSSCIEKNCNKLAKLIRVHLEECSYKQSRGNKYSVIE